MKKLLILITLLAGIPVAAQGQHPVPRERQALIRRAAVSILADTLKAAAARKGASSETQSYNVTSIFASSHLEYAVQDDLLNLRWPVKVSVQSNDPDGHGVSNAYIRRMDFSDLTKQCDYTSDLIGRKDVGETPQDPLLAWLLYAGGYRIREEIVFPKNIDSGFTRDTENEALRPGEPFRELVAKQLPAHNRKAEKSGRIWEITAFDAGSLTLRAAVPGGGQATLQKVWDADPYALVFALALDMGIHFYLYDATQVALPQEAFFSAAEIVKAVREAK